MSPVTSALPHWLIMLALLVVLGVFVFARLSAAGYPRTLAAALSAIALFHPAFVNPAIGIMSVLFALTVYAMAVSAIAFAHSQDPRRTILLGGSLAGAQLVNPICGMLSALSMPVALRDALVSGQTGRTLGQIVSVLFIPALIAVLLISVRIGQSESSFSWDIKSGAHLLEGSEALAHCVIAITPLGLSLFGVHRKANGICETLGGLCATLVATGALDGLLGIRAAPDVTSAVGPLALIVLGTSERKDGRGVSALFLLLSIVAACWIPIDGVARLAGA